MKPQFCPKCGWAISPTTTPNVWVCHSPHTTHYSTIGEFGLVVCAPPAYVPPVETPNVMHITVNETVQQQVVENVPPVAPVDEAKDKKPKG